MCEAATATHQPLPRYDGLDVDPEDLRFGFDSLISLIDWFILWLDELEEHNYHVAVFNVAADDVIVGGKQVLFPRKKYRRSATLRMEEVQ
jgi:hypothetical protein